MDGNYRKNITRGSIWMRLISMIVLAIAFNVAEFVIFVVVVLQFLICLVTGERNERLAQFGLNLARYVQQIIQFLSFATEDRPFPFGPWPDEVLAPSAPTVDATATPTPASEAASDAASESKASTTTAAVAKSEPAAKPAPAKRTTARKPASKAASGAKLTTRKSTSAKSGSATKVAASRKSGAASKASTAKRSSTAKKADDSNTDGSAS